jgi:hypothetical protein
MALAASAAPAAAADADRNGVKASWRLQIAPTLGDPLPLDLGDGLKDYKNTTELSATVSAPIGPLRLTTVGGLKAETNLNDPDNNASALFLKNELYFGRGFRRFSPFLFADGQVGFTNFLDEGSEDSLYYGAGVKLDLLSGTFACVQGEDVEDCFARDPDRSMTLNLAGRVGRNDSTNPAKDYWGPKAGATFLQKFARNRLILNIDLEFEHKEFDAPELDPRRDDQLTASASVNFARAIFPDSPGISKLQLGVRWVRSWSNYEDGRANSAQFLPVLAIGTNF